MSEGWIKLHRSMLKWEWFDDDKTFKVFMYCLLRANFADTKYRGELIKRGSFWGSYLTISKNTNISIQSVRTAIARLKSTGELTVSRKANYSIISITNYEKYQDDNSLSNFHLTDDQQASNRRSTTDKNVKNIKNEKNVKKTNTSPAAHSSAQDDLFAQFWNAYPVKKDKGRCRKIWAKIKPDQFMTNNMISALAEQKAEKDQLLAMGRFCPEWKNPSTWLNNECWDDEVKTTSEINHAKPRSQSDIDIEKSLQKLKEFRNERSDGSVLDDDAGCSWLRLV